MPESEFPPQEFDEWADSYDESVQVDSFPFEGYPAVLQTIVKQAAVAPGVPVLDLGCGTGNLALLLAAQGGRLWCLDFSTAMLEKARAKLPGAAFALADVRSDWPAGFQRRYQAIVSAYTFHHFPLAGKVVQVGRLLDGYLLPGGRLVIGDLTFADAAAQDAYRQRLGPDWEQEYYWLAEESLQALRAMGWQVQYQQVSPCAGVFAITQD